MPKTIDSTALTALNRILGLAGAGSSGETVLEDDSVVQVLDILPIARRSRTPGVSTGMFICILENDHAGADDEQSTIDPYIPGVMINPTGGYPAAVPAGFDIWITGICVMRATGVGDLTGGQIDLQSADSAMGWGVDDTATIVTAVSSPVLAAFAVFNTLTNGGNKYAAEIGTGRLRAKLAQRVRRGQQIRFNSTSGGALNVVAILEVGLFPAGLGQDVVT